VRLATHACRNPVWFMHPCRCPGPDAQGESARARRAEIERTNPHLESACQKTRMSAIVGRCCGHGGVLSPCEVGRAHGMCITNVNRTIFCDQISINTLTKIANPVEIFPTPRTMEHGETDQLSERSKIANLL